jgi:hypothetical protein
VLELLEEALVLELLEEEIVLEFLKEALVLQEELVLEEGLPLVDPVQLSNICIHPYYDQVHHSNCSA